MGEEGPPDLGRGRAIGRSFGTPHGTGVANAALPRIAILGAGPGGYVAALRATRLGAAVTLVETDLIGGTCLNRGCVPTKACLAGAGAPARARAGEAYGFKVGGEVPPDFAGLMARKDRVVAQIRESMEVLATLAEAVM